MVSGHIGIAFLARRCRPDAPIVALLVAALAPDLVDLAYAVVGFDPPCGVYSHSLPAAAALALIALAAAKLSNLSWGATGAIVAVLVLHLPADWITGQKALWPGGPTTSLILYDRPLLDLALELPIAIGGWWLIRRDSGVPRALRSGFALAALIAAQLAFDGAKLGEPPSRPGACALPRAERLHRMLGPGPRKEGTWVESHLSAVRAQGH